MYGIGLVGKKCSWWVVGGSVYMVAAVGGCEVGVGASAPSSMSAMWRSVMRDREEGNGTVRWLRT